MTLEWIRFWITAAAMVIGLAGFLFAVIGVFRFGFIMNRLHSAGIGDTFGLMFIVLSLLIASSSVLDMLKLLLLVFFMWFTSPVSTHFLGQVEYFSNSHLGRYVKAQKGEDERESD